jgi:hypothetical protein
VPEYRFTVVEHDGDRPWVVVTQERHTVTLDGGVDFSEWARERWPSPRFTVELDPHLDPWLRSP